MPLGRRAPAAWDRVRMTGASIGHGCNNKVDDLDFWPVTQAAGGA